MTDRSVDEYEISESDGESIYSESEISSDESMYTSDEEFIEDKSEDVSSDDSESEYVPPYKRFGNENEEKVEIKFENGEWNIVVKKV